MERNVAHRYVHNYSFHENQGHKLLQGLQNLSDGRSLKQQKIGPCFKISSSFQLTLFNPPPTFNRCNRHNKNLLQAQKIVCFCCFVFSNIFTKSRIPPYLCYEV